MKSITVGLFTYQRPKYLQRQLQFFKDLGYDFRLIILDGSHDGDLQRANENIAKSFQVEYHHIIDLRERYIFFSENLDSEFAAWCADDDLIVPSYYNSAAAYMSQNPQYSVVTGQLYTLHYSLSPKWWGYFLRNHLGNHYDIFQGDFVEKIVRKDQAYALGCPPTYYGVRRFENIKLLCKYVSDLKLYSSIERLENVCNLLQGGIKTINVLMGFRDYSSEPTREAQRDDPSIYISEEDTSVLQNIIKQELKKVVNPELLDYYASYAWPLPLRPAQNTQIHIEFGIKERLESMLNLFFGHHHNFEKAVSQAMRKNALRYIK